ncbi:serine/threonine kinase SAD-1-like, partial [Ctenocephalides felis]|uniref:serine/threonine kinase SAD-1-like n=1 Tax=Ctenocephalides felis TaxID=7515 RepID=UPI000E6E3511
LDNLRQLFDKVKRGAFHIPHFVPPDCQALLRGMIEVDPDKRLRLCDVNRHPWVTANGGASGTVNGGGAVELEAPMMQRVQTHVIPSAQQLDADVLRAINSLGCFKERDKLVRELLSPCHNTEKVIYFLLLERKRRRPAYEDDSNIGIAASVGSTGGTGLIDPPRKRLDTCRINGRAAMTFAQISEGSPIAPRRLYSHRQHGSRRTPSVGPVMTTSMTSSSVTSPTRHHVVASSASPLTSSTGVTSPGGGMAPSVMSASVTAGSTMKSQAAQTQQLTTHLQQQNKLQVGSTSTSTPMSPMLTEVIDSDVLAGLNTGSLSASSAGSTQHWRSRLNTIKNNFLGSPRFHRRKMQASSEEVHLTPDSSPELTKRSWFGSLMSGEKDETFTVLVKGKPLAMVKADLIHAFLSVSELSHAVLSALSFRVEYKRGSGTPSAVFQRLVRFQVDVATIVQPPDQALHAITFTLLSGSARRFRRVCEHIQAQVCRRGTRGAGGVGSMNTNTNMICSSAIPPIVSQSSSCGSEDSSERLCYTNANSRQIDSDLESDTSSLYESSSHHRPRRLSAASSGNNNNSGGTAVNNSSATSVNNVTSSDGLTSPLAAGSNTASGNNMSAVRSNSDTNGDSAKQKQQERQQRARLATVSGSAIA